MAEMKDDDILEDIFEKEEVVMDDWVEEQKEVAVEKDVKVAREEGPEKKAEMKDTHDFDEMSVKEEVVMEKEGGVVKEEKAWMKDQQEFEDIFVEEEAIIENVLL